MLQLIINQPSDITLGYCLTAFSFQLTFQATVINPNSIHLQSTDVTVYDGNAFVDISLDVNLR
jgi:hypothetical protein